MVCSLIASETVTITIAGETVVGTARTTSNCWVSVISLWTVFKTWVLIEIIAWRTGQARFLWLTCWALIGTLSGCSSVALVVPWLRNTPSLTQNSEVRRTTTKTEVVTVTSQTVKGTSLTFLCTIISIVALRTVLEAPLFEKDKRILTTWAELAIIAVRTPYRTGSSHSSWTLEVTLHRNTPWTFLTQHSMVSILATCNTTILVITSQAVIGTGNTCSALSILNISLSTSLKALVALFLELPLWTFEAFLLVQAMMTWIRTFFYHSSILSPNQQTT